MGVWDLAGLEPGTWLGGGFGLGPGWLENGTWVSRSLGPPWVHGYIEGDTLLLLLLKKIGNARPGEGD